MGVIHRCVSSTRPPASSSVLPFSRTVMVATDSFVARPATCLAPVPSVITKSTSYSFFGWLPAGFSGSGFAGSGLAAAASFSALAMASCMRRRISANVTTV